MGDERTKKKAYAGGGTGLMDSSVLMEIAQCIASVQDMISFLSAFPVAALDKTLQSFLTLLSGPGSESAWPRLVVSNHLGPLAKAAMPVYRTVDVEVVDELVNFATFRLPWYVRVHASLHHDRPFPLLWAPNVHCLELHETTNVLHASETVELLHCCKHLRRLTCTVVAPHAEAKLASIVTAVAKHDIHSVDLRLGEATRIENAEPFSICLQSPTLTSVSLANIAGADRAMQKLAHALMQSRQIQHLCVSESPDLCRAIVARGTGHFSALKHLEILGHELDAGALAGFPDALRGTQVAAVTVHCSGDVAPLICAFATMPCLTSFDLYDCAFSRLPRMTIACTALRNVRLCSLGLRDRDVAVLLRWFDSCLDLEELSLRGNLISDAGVAVIADILPIWLCRRLRFVDLGDNCIGNSGAMSIAARLATSHHCHSVIVDLHDVLRFAPLQCCVGLLPLVATCFNVTMRVSDSELEQARPLLSAFAVQLKLNWSISSCGGDGVPCHVFASQTSKNS
ncbi:hypothetical protein ACHHYP_06333 [Achlya hypogyna]|uniref:Uncharacterized protein n=1 Tax=Achlya hypogyna TaxID=1202772 RepID=A0A1V9YUC3_ACHHY|nr:hypothetical protein ACHHYP_06333 [Achlya hypogyna]